MGSILLNNKKLKAVENQISFLEKPKGTFHCDFSLITTLLTPTFDGTSKVMFMIHYIPDKKHMTDSRKSLNFGLKCHKCHLGNPTRNIVSRKAIGARGSFVAPNSLSGTVGYSSLLGRKSFQQFIPTVKSPLINQIGDPSKESGSTGKKMKPLDLSKQTDVPKKSSEKASAKSTESTAKKSEEKATEVQIKKTNNIPKKKSKK